MRVRVDPAVCQGHALCGMTAPDIFGFDDDGHAHVLVDVVPVDQEELAHRAVTGCPEHAIRVED